MQKAPYIVILIFCVVAAGIRLMVMPMFPWYIHIGGFFLQMGIFVGLWNLVQWINKQVEKRIRFDKNPFGQVIVQVLISTALISPLFYVSYSLSQHFMPSQMQFIALPFFLIILGLLVLLLNFGFYAYSFFQKLKQSMEEKAALQVAALQLEQEASLVRYERLRDSINPHFLFNALTSLDGLIQSEPALASRFVRHLAKIYRYTLEHKENVVVRLHTEVEVFAHYRSLLEIRYSAALVLEMDFSENALNSGIVMVTLQMLADNAIKHNVAEIENPLHIRIWDKDGQIFVMNNKQLRKQIVSSTQKGLAQFRSLYGFLSPSPVIVTDTETTFQVQFPLL